MKTIVRALALLVLIALIALPALAEEIEIGVLTPAAHAASPDAQTVELFCGPTQGFYRHGEAVFDTGVPYVCFGQYDCWAMVAVGTPEAFGPVGWIEAGFVEDDASSAVSLAFDDALPVMVEDDALLTDDPMHPEAPALAAMPRGTQALLLAVMGDWAYVQTEVGEQPARGFLPLSAIL